MKIRLFILAFIITILLSGVTAFAALPQSSQEDNSSDSVADSGFVFQTDIDLELSEPTITMENGAVVYRTSLLLKDMSEFYGYQIQITSGQEGMVEIENMVGGVTTPAVFKDNKVNFASIVGDGMSSDIKVCDIVCRYPFSDTSKDRTLIIEGLDIVTSIAAERTIKLAGSPQLMLSLPYVAPPFYATVWFYVVIAIVAIAAVALTVLFLLRRLKKSKI